MNTRSSRRKGVSTVIGAVIVFGIFFSVIVPLLLYYQGNNASYNLAISQRIASEQESSLEDLSVSVSLSSSNTMVVKTTNVGSLQSIVDFVLIVDGSQGDVVVGGPFALPYGNTPLAPFQSMSFDTKVQYSTGRYVKVITGRGNVYAAQYSPLQSGTLSIWGGLGFSKMQLSLTGPSGPWLPMYTTFEKLQKGQPYVSISVVNTGTSPLTFTTASGVIFISNSSEPGMGNSYITGRLSANTTIPAGGSGLLIFQVSVPKQLDLKSYPVAMEGFIALVTSQPDFVSLTVPVDSLLLTAAK